MDLEEKRTLARAIAAAILEAIPEYIAAHLSGNITPRHGDPKALAEDVADHVVDLLS